MATITAGDFRNGKTFEYEGKIMTVVEFQHQARQGRCLRPHQDEERGDRRRHRDFLQPHR